MNVVKNYLKFLSTFQGLQLLPELVAGSLSVKLSEMTPNGRSTMVTKDGVRSWPVNFLD